jgi:hypothetical protein
MPSVPPTGVPIFMQGSALDTDVTLRYTLKPSGYSGPADPGPRIESGTISIVTGDHRVRSVFSLATLGAAGGKLSYIFPTSYRDGCGSEGPISIVPISGFRAPAVVVTTLAIGKGCYPVPRVFVPTASNVYSALPLYVVDHRDDPGISRKGNPSAFHIAGVRQILLPDPPKSVDYVVRGEKFAIFDGFDSAGSRSRIAVYDIPDAVTTPSSMPAVGEVVTLREAGPLDFNGAVFLSAQHESRYQYTKAHPYHPLFTQTSAR